MASEDAKAASLAIKTKPHSLVPINRFEVSRRFFIFAFHKLRHFIAISDPRRRRYERNLDIFDTGGNTFPPKEIHSGSKLNIFRTARNNYALVDFTVNEEGNHPILTDASAS